MRITQKVVKEALSEYLGEPVDQVKMHEDPKVAGTWAFQACVFGGWQGFLAIHANEAKDAKDLAENYLEEAEFTEWPPKSGEPKFI